MGDILHCGGIIRVTSTKIDIDAFPSQLGKSPSLTSTGLSDLNADQRYGVIVNGKPSLTVTEAARKITGRSPVPAVQASDRYQMANEGHIWGLSPFHYVPGYYPDVWHQLAGMGA